MFFSDSGIVLSSRKFKEDLKIVSILTKGHGRVVGLTKVLKRNSFSSLSIVDVEMRKKDTQQSLGFWFKKQEKQNWSLCFQSRIFLLVCQSVCLTLDKVLPIGAHFPLIFNFFYNFLQNFKEDEAITAYAFFEFLLLKESGFGFDLNTCSICGKPEKVKYLFPDTGRTAESKCYSPSSTHLFEIPEIWFTWEKGDQDFRRYQKEEVLNSLSITKHFISKNLPPFSNCFRESVVSHLFSDRQEEASFSQAPL